MRLLGELASTPFAKSVCMLAGISTICFAACYAIALGLEVVSLRSRAAWRRAALIACTAAGVLAHTLYLGYRGAEAGEIPASTAAEWLQLASWVLAVVYFASLFYLSRTPTGIILLPIVLGLAIGSHWASTELLAPERTFYAWRMFHGIALLLGTVAVCIGFVAGLMYLVQSYALKHARSPANGLRLPSLEWLERINSRTLGLSAVLIALGFLSGVAMSVATHRNQATYDLWTDPVVLSLASMLLWLIVAEVFRLLYPAARRGRKVAYLTLASFVFLVIALASLMWLDTAHEALHGKTIDDRFEQKSTGQISPDFRLRISACGLDLFNNWQSKIQNPKSIVVVSSFRFS